MKQQAKPAVTLPPDLWRRDELLRRAAEVIENSGGKIRAVSFDFFDTLVWRLVARPTDVFNEVGRRLHEAGKLRNAISEGDFEVLRRHAEMKTRERQCAKNASWEDISISDIYTHQLKPIVLDTAVGVPIEHGVESEVCMLNPSMIGFVEHIKKLGLKIAVISDIYFSTDHLRGILRANNFDPGIFDLMVTSCDEGVCKGTGNLFKRALNKLKLSPEQLFHIGDNYTADVVGARRASVRSCHYQQATHDLWAVVDRENFLRGAMPTVFSANSMRMLAARHFPENTAEGFFARMGAFTLGPVLTRFSAWACRQYLEGGVRKVGAFMREGELFGQMLQQEADLHGYDLDVKPLYVNRKATDLAAIGKLTADNLIRWLEARPTLPVGKILEHFGLPPADVRRVPIPLDQKADKKELILKLAKFLFTPDIAGRIEARSAEERRKVIDYLQPWLSDGNPIGVCDIGYSASAQTQMKRIFELEGIETPMIGCYLVSYERAADRVLDGVDIRHFLGDYGKPDFLYRAFIRAPAFLEQAMVAPCGTTLGYERKADGTVVPVLDETPFAPETLRRQRSFKEGTLFFQDLWHWFELGKPGLLDGSTEVSKRVLLDVDRMVTAILGRATAFPLTSEIAHFGAIPLDDYYFSDSFKPMCGEKDLDQLRKKGYANILGQAGIHWPQGVHEMGNPKSAANFFAYGKAMLLCNTDGDSDAVSPDLSVIVQASRNPARLRECLSRLKALANPNLRCDVLLLTRKDDEAIVAVAKEFMREMPRLRVFEYPQNQPPSQSLNAAGDNAIAPIWLVLDDGVLLPAGWDALLLKAFEAADVGFIFPKLRHLPSTGGKSEPRTELTPRCFGMRRGIFMEGLGFQEELGTAGSSWNLIMEARTLAWKAAVCDGFLAEAKAPETEIKLRASDADFLARHRPGFAEFAKSVAEGMSELPVKVASALEATTPHKRIAVDWIGSFLDHGSLSHVNRELTRALRTVDGLALQRVSRTVNSTAKEWQALSRELATSASNDASVTVRHAWPPDWQRPKNGALVVIQPWEFGSLPEQWVKDLARVDEVWIPSEYVRRVYVESGVPAEKVVVVPNGVDPEKFNPQAAPLALATKKKFKFLFVGGTIFRKGPDILLDSYLRTFTAEDDVCLVIKDFGGNGVYAGQTFEAKIRAAQQQPGAPEILYLNNEMSPDSLPGLYTACNCLVLPYRGEGYGLPVVEAMACGLAVIVTADGATDDFVRDEFGWRIPSQKSEFGNEVGGIRLVKAGWLLEPDPTMLGLRLRHAFTHPEEVRERGQLASNHARQFCDWRFSAAIAAERIRELSSRSTTGTAKAASAPTKPKGITLPECGKIGHLGLARELLREKKSRLAWEASMAALALRPFHPEAYGLLAEIAAGVGNGQDARLLAEHARQIAPGWKPVRQLLNQRLKGGARPEWMKLPESLPHLKPANPGKLTVGLIVKNEEKFLGQCLESVRNLAHQIVVVDTGSTDRTVAIAKEHGAEVNSFTWCDDFSTARNAVLEHVTGDWVLMLDADEQLSAEGREKILKLMSQPEVLAWRLPMVDVGREAEGVSYVPRLFRNAPGLFYVGRVHEQVFSSIEVRREEWGLENRIGDATLIHHGYVAEVVRDRNKIERNLKLLERAIEEMPGEPHLLMNYGLELARSGREAEAIEQYRQAFQFLSGKPAAEIVPELRETLLTQLCSRLASTRQFEEIVQTLTSSLAKSGQGLTASHHFSLGLAYIETARYREAADQMQLCLQKRAQPALSPIIKEIMTAAPRHCLAVCLARLGDFKAADQCFQEALKEPGLTGGARLDYAKFLFDQNRPVESLQCLHETVRLNTNDSATWRLGGQIALSHPQFLEFARDWTGEALRYLPDDPIILGQRAEALMLSGKAAEASALWERLWNLEPKPRNLAALVICEVGEGVPPTAPRDEAESEQASRAFLEWYRKLVNSGARDLIQHLNERPEALRLVLPGAARIVDAVMVEAGRATVEA